MTQLCCINDTATTEIYTLSLHDALPISAGPPGLRRAGRARLAPWAAGAGPLPRRRGGGGPLALEDPRVARQRGQRRARSEEHTSELQSRQYLVCRLLLEKKTISKH